MSRYVSASNNGNLLICLQSKPHLCLQELAFKNREEADNFPLHDMTRQGNIDNKTSIHN